MARVVLRRVCPSLHPLQTLLCVAFCAPEAVVSGLFSVARDQRMLIPGVALPHMLFAISCLGHIQQRPGSDLPQLRAGELMWLTSPGLPVEVFEVTSHLVWTHQTTNDPRQMLGPRSPLSVRPYYTLLNRPRRMALRQAHHRFIVHALRHSAGRHHLCWLLWPVAASPVGEWAQESLLGFGCQLRVGSWCMPTLSLSSMSMWCCGLRCPWRLQMLEACFLPESFWECSIGHAVCNWVQGDCG
jgi:hypothetical protein